MTIHEALPSSGRSRLILAAALIAILALAAGALLWRPLTAFAHHTTYSAKGTCAGWEAEAKYVGGSTHVLIVLENVVVGGDLYHSSWTAAKTFTEITSYGGGAIAGKPFQSGEAPTNGAHLWYWSGKDNGFTIFSRNGSWPAGTFSGRILLYRDEGKDGDWDRWDEDTVTSPDAPSKCEFKVCKVVVPNGDGQTDGGTFSFEISIDNGIPQSFTLTDNEGGGLGKEACTDFLVDPGSTATVTELPARPPDWLGDESGYPKYQIDGQSEQTGSQATLQFSGSASKVTVEFRNKEIKSRNLEVCKKVESDGQSPNKEKWDFTFQVGWGNNGSATVTIEDVKEGEDKCEKVEVPEDASVTVTESGRPQGWTGDVSGYPKYKIGSGDWTEGDSATVPSNKNKVTFTNKELRTGNIQVHKYLPKQNENDNAPWQNQGNGPSQWEFTVYGSLQDAQDGTDPLATFSQLGSNSPDLPQTDLWIKETGMPNGYQFFGWYVPDGDGNSGNDKCNQQPLDGSTLNTNTILHIPASYWSTKGNKTGLLHICAYNKPGKRTVRVIKVIEGTAFP